MEARSSKPAEPKCASVFTQSLNDSLYINLHLALVVLSGAFFVTKLMNQRPAFSGIVIVVYNAFMELPMTFR